MSKGGNRGKQQVEKNRCIDHRATGRKKKKKSRRIHNKNSSCTITTLWALPNTLRLELEISLRLEMNNIQIYRNSKEDTDTHTQ